MERSVAKVKRENEAFLSKDQVTYNKIKQLQQVKEKQIANLAQRQRELRQMESNYDQVNKSKDMLTTLQKECLKGQ